MNNNLLENDKEVTGKIKKLTDYYKKSNIQISVEPGTREEMLLATSEEMADYVFALDSYISLIEKEGQIKGLNLERYLDQVFLITKNLMAIQRKGRLEYFQSFLPENIIDSKE